MFRNAGGKLSAIQKVLTIIMMVAAVVAGISMATVIGNPITILAGLLGALLIWYGSLFTIAILEALSDIYKIREKLDQMCINQNPNVLQQPMQQVAQQQPIQQAMPLTGVVPKVNENSWFCECCGKQNKENSKFCSACGKEKIN